MLWYLAGFVIVIYLVANVAETVAHRSPSFNYPNYWIQLEDLRLAYAPNLALVYKSLREYSEIQRQEIQLEQIKYEKEMWARYESELKEAKIKRWLEGNPVTDENPLTKKERPVPPCTRSADSPGEI